MNKTEDIIKKSQNWLRLSICVSKHLVTALLNALHNDGSNPDPSYKGIPRDPKALYAFFSTADSSRIINFLVRKRLLNPAQIDLLLPPNKETHSCKFDPTLSLVIMRNFTTLKTLNGRCDTLLPNDNSLAANAVRAVLLRNFLYHYHDITLMTKQEFDKKWTEAENIAAGLLYLANITKLKTKTLDPEGSSVKKEFCRYLNAKLGKLKEDYEELKTKSEADGREIAKIKYLEKEVILIKENEIKNEKLCNYFQHVISIGESLKDIVNQANENFVEIAETLDDLDTRVTTLEGRTQSSKVKKYVLILFKRYLRSSNLIYQLF